jgi:CheY-like chemotaxis protein
MTVALLDDDPKRIEAMRRVLSGLGEACVSFATAHEMVDWLAKHLQTVRFVSLDHDLGPYDDAPAPAELPGNGQDVVDMLVRHKPACPVIVHSSNDYAASGMVGALRTAGWVVRRVLPAEDLAWIETSWAQCVRRSLARDKA